MTIYMKDGYVASIDNQYKDDSYLEVNTGKEDGYIHIIQRENYGKGYYVRFTAPKENVIFIDYENHGGGENGEMYRDPLVARKRIFAEKNQVSSFTLAP